MSIEIDAAELIEKAAQFTADDRGTMDAYKELLESLLKAVFYEKDYAVRNELLQAIFVMRRTSIIEIGDQAEYIAEIADKYRDEPDFAEYLLRMACEMADDDRFNCRLTKVMRRKKGSFFRNFDIIDLLIRGVEKRSTPFVIEMGLHFALGLSTPDDWQTAEELFDILPCGSAEEVIGEYTPFNEMEERLIHFFLLKNKKITESQYGSASQIAAYLEKIIESFPKKYVE